jgi:hypothetical protein
MVCKVEYKTLQLGFSVSKADSSLFFLRNETIMMFILVYVNAIIVTSSQPHAVIGLLKNLCDDFALKELDNLHYFFGIEVKKLNDGIMLSQDKYVNVLTRAGMMMCKAANTPLATRDKLALHIGSPLSPNDATSYRSIVDAL